MQKRLKINHFILHGGLLLVGLFAFIFNSVPIEAATGVNQTINFQGRLLNNQGATAPDGFYNIQFKIYQDGDGQSVGNTTGLPAGSLKWTESHLNTNSQGVKVINGYLSVNLGSITAFGTSIDWNQDTLWLSMNVGNTNTTCTPFSSCTPDGEMVPMQPMTSAPYALNSGRLGGLTSSEFVQIAQGLQTDASNAETIAINKTGTGNILDLQKSGNSVFLISNTGQTTITTTATNALLVRDASGSGFLSVDTSGGIVKIGATGASSSNSTINIADTASGIQTVSIGSTNSSSTTTIRAGSGGITLNGDITISSGKNFTQSGTGTFSTGSGSNTLNGDTSIAANKNFTQNGTGTFSTGSGTNTLNGDTTVAGTKTFTVNGGNTSLGANLDVTGSEALKKGTDFSTTGTTNNANFANASLIKLTGASAQTITGIANGRDGYVLTLVNAASAAATLTNNDTNSSAANRITTGSGGSISIPVGSSITLVYDSGASLWRASSGSGTTLQTAYNNSTTSPQITLSSANGGLVVQDASSAIGADLFTVQSNGGSTKYFNVNATTVAINDNLTVSGTYNTNTFTSTALTFGGASGTISTSSGNLTIQAASTNSLLLDTVGAGSVSIGSNALTVNVGASNVAHNIHVGDGGTSTTQAITIGSSGSAASAVTIIAGSSGGITLNGDITVSSGKNFTQSGTGAFSTGSGSIALNGDTAIAANKNFTQNGTGTFSTGSGANSLNGDVTVATGKNFTQNGAGTFSSGSGTNTLNGDTTVAGTKTFTVNGGNTTLGANLDVTGSASLKKGTDFSTTGTTNNASFANASLIRLTGASAQTITGISGGRDGYILTLINAGSTDATITNNDSNSLAANRIITGTGASISLLANATVTLVYDSTAAVWHAGSVTSVNNLQTAYNNSTSPQITLSSANGGLVVQDASSAIGASLFTVQSNGGATKYFNVDASTVAINDNLTVSGTINSNTFTSTALTFGGGSSTISTSSGNLTIQAPSTNSLLLDTAGAGSVSLGSNALTVNIGASNVAHNIHVGDGGTSATQTIVIGSNGSVSSSVSIIAGSSGGITLNGDITVSSGKNFTQSGAGSFSSGSGSVALNGDTAIAANKNFTQNGTGTFSTGSGAVSLNGDTTIASGKNFTQSGGGTFSTGTGANSLNGDTTIASGKNFTQNGGGTFSSGSGTNTLNGDTTVAGTKTFTVNGGNTTLGANLDVTGSTAYKKGTDFSTNGTTDNAPFSNASLIRLTGTTAQTITGIAGGRDGYLLTIINAGSVAATLTNNDSNSSAGNRITTGGGSISLPVGANIALVYDSTAAVWRTSSGNTTSLQAAYNNSTSPQITLSSANGGLVVQDASSAIGADLFTVQSNGGSTKYLNVTSSTVAINDNVTVSGTYNTNTFTSTALTFGGASGTVSSSSGNLTIQAASSNALILDTAGAGTVSLATGNAVTINVATNNTAHAIHIGDGGTSTAQTITIGSSGAVSSSVTLVAGSSGGITLNGDVTVSSGKNFTQAGAGSFSSGSGSVSLNGDTTIAANKNFTQSGTGTFSTGSGAVSINGDTTIAANKNFTQSGTGTFSTGSGTNTLNGDVSITANKNFTQNGSGTFSSGSGTNTLNGDTTVAGTKNFTVNGGNTTLGAKLDVTGSTALKKGADFSTTGTTNDASFADTSLIRLTGASAQTITGISGGRDGYILTIINAGSTAATLTNNDSNSSAGNRIITGTSGSVTMPAGSVVTLVYDSTTAVWRAGSIGGGNLQTAYNNSTTSPQITLSSANGGLVVQDASSAIGADLFTVQSNGGSTKYFNVNATTVAINDNLTVSGTYNTNTFTSTALTFGGASGTISTSSGNLTVQAASTNSLLLDTGGAGTISIATGNAATVNVATNNIAHAIHIGDGGTSTAQAITIGSTGASASSVTINAGASGGLTINTSTTISGANSFSTGSGNVNLNGDTAVASGKNFTQNGAGTFSTGTGAVSLNGDTTVASGKNFSQTGAGTFSTGTGANSLNGNTTVATNKSFSALGDALFKDATNSASAFQVQNNSTFNVLAVDTSANHLKVYDGTATQAYVDIYYDDASSSAVIAASTGTTKIGNGTGAVTVNAGTGAAVNITGHASSTWSLDSGNLTIDVTNASTPSLNLGTGAQAKNITIGNVTGATSTTIQGGSGGVVVNGNTSISGTSTFSTGTGAVSLNGISTVANGKTLVLGSNSGISGLTCTNGAMFYDTSVNRFKGCESSAWITLDNYADLQHYTGSGSWTKLANVTSVQVILVGGGGGGGGGGARNGGQERNGGGGGGGGAYVSQVLSAADLSSGNVTVGSAGSAGSGAASSATAGSSGGAGGTSCFSTGSSCSGTIYTQAYGGGGGGGGNQAGTAGGAGAGGGGAGAAGSTPANTTNTAGSGGGPAGGAANASTSGGAGAGGGSATSGAGTAGNAGGAAEYGGAGGGGAAGGNAASGAGGSSVHGAGGGGAGGSTNSGNSTGNAGAGGISQSISSGGGGTAGSTGCTGGGNGGSGSSIKAGQGGGGGGANGGGGSAGCAAGNGGQAGGGGGGGGSGSTSGGNGGTGGAGEAWVISW
jgi:fibronectin-binding autotransporter adhesin